MTLNEVMQVASTAYDQVEPDLFGGYWDFETGKPKLGDDGFVVRHAEDGRDDGLVRFLVVEIMETWEPELEPSDQVEQVMSAIDRASEQVAAISAAIIAKAYGPPAGTVDFKTKTITLGPTSSGDTQENAS